MIHPAVLAGYCPAASERRTPTLARARAATDSGRQRAGRVALIAHLLLRRITERWRGHRLSLIAAGRMRHALQVPGGPGDEANHLLELLDALADQSVGAAVARALASYAIHLESEGHYTEALLALERLLAGLPAFSSEVEALELALLVARLNVTVARWQGAAGALRVADTVAGSDPVARSLVVLVRATALVAQGGVEAARDLIESVQGWVSDEMAGADRLGPAWLALGAALEARGVPLEALQAYHRALIHAAAGAPRRRVLAALGELLRGLGAGAAARQAFTLALAGPIPLADQIAARIELLDLAIGLGDRVAFERERRELATWQDQLPAAAAVEFLTHAAQGLEEFGQMARAGRMLIEAQQLAERHQLHEAWFRLERLVIGNRRGPLRRATVAASVLPLPWEYPEIAAVAEALDRQLATMAGSA